MSDLLTRDPLIVPLAASFGMPEPILIVLSILVTIWTIYWTAVGLWAAAQNRQHIWFGAMFLLPVMGVLAILYLIWFEKEHTNGRAHLLPLPKAFRTLRTRLRKEASVS